LATYNVTVTDSVLSNRNANGIFNASTNNNGNEDAQIRYNGTESPETTAINLTVRNVKISGLGRGNRPDGGSDPDGQLRTSSNNCTCWSRTRRFPT
jgi:hypothetical protein